VSMVLGCVGESGREYAADGEPGGEYTDDGLEKARIRALISSSSAVCTMMTFAFTSSCTRNLDEKCAGAGASRMLRLSLDTNTLRLIFATGSVNELRPP
jgi:hypothetical protein